jgi:nitroimidazol reductase NimA-like FMN-containing flavoprotein (pyridoxamine 5'-phosphate oxidase superfamily)
MIVKEMTRQECTALLSSSRMGRLACAKDDQPYIVPINFAFADSHIYSFSLIGQKVEWMRQNPHVCLHVDKFGEGREWRSVVVYGVFEELPDRVGWKSQRDHAWSVLSKHASWWEPGGLKPVSAQTGSPISHLFYRITIDRITGRQAIDE